MFNSDTCAADEVTTDSLGKSTGLPLRAILIASALLQIYAYVAVVLYSLWIGATDLAAPIKIAFVVTLMILIALAVSDVVNALRTRKVDPSQIGVSIYRLVVELAASIGLFYLGYKFLPEPFSNVDMRTLSNEVKLVASVGIIAMVAFTFMVIADLLALKRKGDVPPVLPVSPVPEVVRS